MSDQTEFNSETGAKSYNHDTAIDTLIKEHIEQFDLDALTVLQNWSVLLRRQPLKRFLLHYELFTQTLNIPGDIAEFGVYRGLGLMTWANFLEARVVGDRTKTVFGFDNWQGFTAFDEKDGQENEASGKTLGGFNPARFKEELESAINIFDQDRFVPWKKRVKLIDGDVVTSFPQFIQENPGVRFSLVHFDMDLYQPTKVVLEHIWDKVCRGGILMFDEYGIHDWPGETQAVDEFLADKPELQLQTSEWTNVPAAWLVKP